MEKEVSGKIQGISERLCRDLRRASDIVGKIRSESFACNVVSVRYRLPSARDAVFALRRRGHCAPPSSLTAAACGKGEVPVYPVLRPKLTDMA